MNKNILLLLLAAATTHAQEFFSLGFAQEIPADTTQIAQHNPMASLMLAMQNMHKSNSLKSGFEFASHLELQKEKMFLGIRASVPEKLMLRYLHWQREGELSSMKKELVRVEGKITKHHAFKRFKWERRKSLLLKVMNNEITKNLSIVSHGSLEQAEAMVQLLENPPVVQFADDAYIAMKREERILARQILEKRTDYRNKIQQQQQKASQVSYTTHSTQATVESSTTFSSGIYVDSQQVFNTTADGQTVYDLKLTTPTDIDQLFKQRVTANPEIDFKEYLSQTGQLLYELGSKGLYTADQFAAFTKEVGQGIAKHLAHVVQHPVEYAQEFATATADMAKVAVQFVLILGAAPEGPYATEAAVQQYMQLVDQKMSAMTASFDQLCVIVPQMSRSEWADLLSKIIVDGLITHNVGKGVSFVRNTKLPASILESPLLSKVNTSLERSLAQQVRAVIVEGLTFKASQAMEETNLLKSVGEKTIGGPLLISAEEKLAVHKEWFDLANKVEQSLPQAKPGTLEPTGLNEFTRYISNSEKLYEQIRVANDVEAIAKNTNLPKDMIQKIKQHVFFNEHILSEGKMRFPADGDMAAAWIRLQENKAVATDILLLKHELAEAILMDSLSISQREAHDMVNKCYNWQKSYKK